MRAFEVKEGTKVKVIKDGKEWVMSNFTEVATKQDWDHITGLRT